MDSGVIAQGYRQFAYPFVISLTDQVSVIGGWDRSFGIALLQRVLLLAACGVLLWALRYWAVPILLLITSPVYTAQMNLLLPEGLIVPLSILSSALAVGLLSRRPPVRGRNLWLVLSILLLSIALATMLKIQAAVLFFVFVVVVVDQVSRQLLSKRQGIGLLGAFVAFISLLSLVQAMENSRETGEFLPVSESARAAWWGAWQSTFTLEEGNKGNPDLAPFYDEGNLFTFLHGLEANEPSYQKRSDEISARIRQMLDQAGITPQELRINAIAGGLVGGRIDDMRGIVNTVVREDPVVSDEWYLRNSLGRDGVTAVQEAINDGRAFGVLTITPVVQRLATSSFDYRNWRVPLAVGSFVLLIFGLVVTGWPRHLALAGIAVVVAPALAMSSAYIDNARYFIAPWTVALILAIAVAKESFVRLRGRWRDGDPASHTSSHLPQTE